MSQQLPKQQTANSALDLIQFDGIVNRINKTDEVVDTKITVDVSGNELLISKESESVSTTASTTTEMSTAAELATVESERNLAQVCLYRFYKNSVQNNIK